MMRWAVKQIKNVKWKIDIVDDEDIAANDIDLDSILRLHEILGGLLD